MKILDNYMAKEFIKTYLVILTAFFTIFIVIDVIDNLPKLIRAGASIDQSAVYYLLRIPQLFILTSPITVLLAGLFMMNGLAKYNESVAVRSAGIGIKRMVLPILGIGFLIFLANLVIADRLLPLAESKREYFYKVVIKKQTLEDKKIRSKIHYIGHDQSFYYIGYFNGYINQMKVVDITRFSPKTGEITEKISAAKALWKDDYWLFLDCDIRTFKDKKPVSFNHYANTKLSFVDVTPKDFVQRTSKTMSMNYFELLDYINSRKKVGDEYLEELVDLYTKITYPLSNFIILLFCVPAASTNTRSKKKGWVFLSGILICLVYLSTLRICQSLGYNEVLPPWLAAWLPNFIFFSLGTYFVYKAEI
ncbi:MAG: LptF/LptG family permease [Candidatus Cloacimonetes bacterium]|nr:LptF/LptG family permease [Candidatus Cloacimonadota bacterium]